MNEIVRCVIHPGVGIARLGNSPDAYVIGPEAPGELPQPEGGFKDLAGRTNAGSPGTSSSTPWT